MIVFARAHHHNGTYTRFTAEVEAHQLTPAHTIETALEAYIRLEPSLFTLSLHRVEVREVTGRGDAHMRDGVRVHTVLPGGIELLPVLVEL